MLSVVGSILMGRIQSVLDSKLGSVIKDSVNRGLVSGNLITRDSVSSAQETQSLGI
jgi:hypothetical protein